MRRSYRRRPYDFKRRILSKTVVRKELLEEEYKWLCFIKEEELGKRYYNLSKKHFGHWSEDENKRLAVGRKISQSPLRNERIGRANKGRLIPEEVRQKNREAAIKQYSDPKYRELNRRLTLEMWKNLEYRNLQVKKKKGRHWFTDGINDVQTWGCPEGFYKGRTRVCHSYK